jgi:hypothetical protein
MAKVITFCTKFPSYHPRAGRSTYFVEAIYKNIGLKWKDIPIELQQNIEQYVLAEGFSKGHTIRKGNRFKKGDFFSPRVWGTDINPKSGKSGPYHSKQIILSQDIEIKNVWDIEIYNSHEVYIDGVFHCSFGSENWEELCKNDGLSSSDMKAWFSKLPFKGQIICWNDSVNY